jgi:hypothetical protein
MYVHLTSTRASPSYRWAPLQAERLGAYVAKPADDFQIVALARADLKQGPPRSRTSFEIPGCSLLA